MRGYWWHVVKHVVFGIHSPARIFLNQCWCQRKTKQPTPMSQEELNEAIRRSAERAYRSFGE